MTDENPNEYDDDAFVIAANDVHASIGAMWDAGATESDIRDAVDNAIQDCL